MSVAFTVTPERPELGSNATLVVEAGSTFGTAGRVQLETSAGSVGLPVVGAWTPATLVVTLPETAAPGPYAIVVDTELAVVGNVVRGQGRRAIELAPGSGTGTGDKIGTVVGDLLNPGVFDSLGGLGAILRGTTIPVLTEPQPDPTAAVPAGKYRATLASVACHRETSDHMLEVDGKRDEVYFYVAGGTIALTPSGVGDLSVSDTTSPVHGDTNNQHGRVQAGSASDRGGIRTGDRFDVGLTIWEGDLAATSVGVVVPTVWEWDGDPAHIRLSWQSIIAAQVQGLAAAVAGSIGAGVPDVRSPLSSPLASVNLDEVLRDTAPQATGPVGAALPEPMVDSELPGMFGLARNRPIGYQRVGDRDAFYPKALVLTAAVADALTRTDLGHGPGVVEVRYTDREDLKGDYSLFIRVERI